MTDAEMDAKAHELATAEARDCECPEGMDAASFAAGVYAFAYVTYRAQLASGACICGPDHDCRATGCDDDCPACSV